MQNVVIVSPENISNKEKYLSEELSSYTNREICAIKKLENGEIKITFGEETEGVKHFVKVFKKKKYKDVQEFMKYYERELKDTNAKREPKLYAEFEYKKFWVLFFIIKKR